MPGIVPLQNPEGLFIGMEYHLFPGQWCHQPRKIPEPAPVDEQAVKGIAHRRPPGLGVENNACTLLRIPLQIEKGMTDPCSRLNDGHPGMLPDIVNESLASAGNNQVDVPPCLQHLSGFFSSCRKQGDHFHGKAVPLKHISDDRQNGRVRSQGITPPLQEAAVA